MNTYELYLLKILFKKSNYINYFSFIELNKLKEINREIYYLFITLREIFEDFPNDLTIDEFLTFFYVKYPESDRVVYDKLFNTLRTIDISAEAADDILNKIAAKQRALDISEMSFKAAQGVVSFAELEEFLSKNNTKVDHQTSFTSSMDLDEILQATVQDEGLRWRLSFLNKSLGSLRKGDFGYVFARPEVGKTAFLASEIGNMLDQTDGRVVWYNAEEQDAKVKLRIYQSYFGITLEQLLASPKKYKELFQQRVGDKLQFFGLERCNKRDVEEIGKDMQPVLTVYDQLSKWKGFQADRDDLRLGAIFMWAREQAKLYGAAIGVHQADGHAEGVKWLTMDHCANAKTAIQAEADWILGIGKTHVQGEENVRYLSICKNKLLGSADSLPDLRHGRGEVLLQSEIMRYKDIIEYN